MSEVATTVHIPHNLAALYELVHGLNGDSREVLRKVTEMFPGVSQEDLLGKRRHQGVSRPRQHAMFLLRECYGLSSTETGLRLGGRDHTTVLYAIKKIKGEISRSGVDPSLFSRDFEPEQVVFTRSREMPNPNEDITDLANSSYRLGHVKVFPSLRAGIGYWEDLKGDYGHKGVRHGPAIDISARRLMVSPLASGFYFHAQAAFNSEADKQEDAPILSSPNSLTLEEALLVK